MKKIITLVCLMALITMLMVSTSFGQSAASVSWNLTVTDSLNVSLAVGNVTGLKAAGTDSFIVRSYSGTAGGGPGPLGNFLRWSPGASYSWGLETGENAYHYVQFVASPKSGASLKVDSVTFYTSGGGTGNMRAFAYYSKDGFATRTVLTPAGGTSGDTLVLPNSGTAYVSYLFPVNTTVASGQSFSVRFYPWYTGSASTSKYFYTQYVVIKGTTTGGTGVAEQEGIPGNFELAQNYPNPFNPATQISYSIAKASFVTLKVYNLIGQEVATLVSNNQAAGRYTVPFNATSLGSGVYLYRLQAGSSMEVKRMMLVK